MNNPEQQNHDKVFDIAIVGGGIVGLATAYKIQKKYPELKLVVLEKEKKLASHQTGRNSGVIHSGIYYKPGSLRAENCSKGRVQLVEFCKEHNVTHDVCGKLIVAATEDEIPRLDGILERGKENGLENLEIINSEEIKQIEPFIEGIKAIKVPQAGLVDFVGVTNKLAELLLKIQPDSEIVTDFGVINWNQKRTKEIIGIDKTIFAKNIVFCSGLQADRMAKKDNVDLEIRTVGFRGDYYELTEKGKKKIKHLVYPVPNPAFPFLGVHFTRMHDGTIECGPNAVFTFKREGYGKTDFNFKDTLEALTYQGTWKLFFKHWKFGLDEYRRAFSKQLFLKQLQRLCPSLEMDDIEEGRSGVRAIALQPDGEVFDDFIIEYKENAIHVLNAPSPAATACLAIGDSVCDLVSTHFKLKH
ncbi:MAG: L-2-hydroxyglutarate oxidase [Flavobacteriales bacterium]|jgi:L-2-hydroxyglutarate oxidase|nr:L-2-hydroxyglutarate oxidase [Flavobacteriales bacterium]